MLKVPRRRPRPGRAFYTHICAWVYLQVYDTHAAHCMCIHTSTPVCVPVDCIAAPRGEARQRGYPPTFLPLGGIRVEITGVSDVNASFLLTSFTPTRTTRSCTPDEVGGVVHSICSSDTHFASVQPTPPIVTTGSTRERPNARPVHRSTHAIKTATRKRRHNIQ